MTDLGGSLSHPGDTWERAGAVIRSEQSAVARRLITTANELLATAYELCAGCHSDHPGDPAGADCLNEAKDRGPMWLAAAREAYRDRRRRADVFDAELFGEPAWDILLDLFIAAREGKRISITSACIGSAAPSTTALRWLTILERSGLIEREGDDRDNRRSYVRLTSAGDAKMVTYFRDSRFSPDLCDAAPRRRNRAFAGANFAASSVQSD